LTEAARSRLAFALDYPTLDEARRGAAPVCEFAGVLKVGLELFLREGPPSVAFARELGASVFLDLKLHDIPETVERAVASAAALGARYLTLHASGGPQMMEAAARRAERENRDLILVGVTLLTSLDAKDLAAMGVSSSPAEQALRLGKLARSAGLRGLVCSVAEVASLRAELGPEMTLITPGIRPSSNPRQDDQKRVGTPAEAISAGASLLVVGRPIRDAADPAAVARTIVEEIAEASGVSTS
jgi:orotidine-5'-phosphate decarboxylase